MKHPAFKYVKYVLFLGITLLLLWWVFPPKEDQATFWNAFRNANFWWVLLSVAIILISHLSRAKRWQMLITPTGTTPRLSTTFGAVLIGYFANLAFPRLGEVSKCGIVNRYERIPVDKLIGTMVTERAIDLLTLLLLTALILAVEFERFGSFFSTEIATPLGEKFAANLWLVLIVIAVTAAVVIALILSYRKRSGIFMRLRAFLSGIWQGMKTISKVRSMPALIAHSVFIWVCYFLATWACFLAMSGTESLGASAALAVLVFGSFGMVAPVQGGLGAFHVMAIATLEAYAVTKTEATSFAFLLHESQMFIVIVTGSLALIVLPFLHRRRTNARASQVESQGS